MTHLNDVATFLLAAAALFGLFAGIAFAADWLEGRDRG